MAFKNDDKVNSLCANTIRLFRSEILQMFVVDKKYTVCVRMCQSSLHWPDTKLFLHYRKRYQCFITMFKSKPRMK